MRYQLAQVNIARMRAAPDDPAMASLMNRLEEINQLAEQSPGFAWRLPGNQVTEHDLQQFSDFFEPFTASRLFYNLSVWETIGDLRQYVYRSRHVELLRDKHQWLEKIDRGQLAMWWVPHGHRPTVAESAERLRRLEAQGSSPFAFSFARAFQPPE